jgi:hypothetical protein
MIRVCQTTIWGLALSFFSMLKPVVADSAKSFKRHEATSKWLRCGARWQKCCPIDESQPGRGSWLDHDVDRGAGCRICCAGDGLQGKMASYKCSTPDAMQMCNFVRHASQPSHKRAVAKYLGKDVVIDSDTPTDEEYRRICKEILAGNSTLSTPKDAKMTYTLSEAVKSVGQKAVDDCHSIALFRDESKSRLALRFRTVSDTLDTFSGFLGQERDPGTGALNVTKATKRVMTRFCSRFSGAPYLKTKKVFLKTKTFRNLRHKVKAVTVDAAGDEVLSVEMMRSAKLSGEATRLTPNCKFLNRDKTHGSRRLISRGWGADKFLNENVTMFARGRGSIARIIQNSPAVRSKFNGFCKTTFRSVLVIVRNMRAALHRYETMQKPFGRTVLFTHGCVKTALWCALRADDTAIRAKAWLRWIDEEKCVQSAMQADASDQTLFVTRQIDNEDVDAATIRRRLFDYLSTIDWLLDGPNPKILTVFGYTKTMLSTLRRPLVWHLGNQSFCLGSSSGVSDEIITRCLDRMRCWKLLMKATVAAEFPSFEIMHVRRCALGVCVCGGGGCSEIE